MSMKTEVTQDEDESSILAYISGSGQQPFLDERIIEPMTASLPTTDLADLHVFQYDLTIMSRATPHLQTVDVSQWQDGVETYLKRLEWRLMDGSEPSWQTYESDTASNNKYLVLAPVGQHLFAFLIRSEWDYDKLISEYYGRSPMLPKRLLPEPSQPPDNRVIHNPFPRLSVHY
jgi:hypothetical protein